jgi:hypothetical protein
VPSIPCYSGFCHNDLNIKWSSDTQLTCRQNGYVHQCVTFEADSSCFLMLFISIWLIGITSHTYHWLGLYGVMAIQSSSTALDLNAQALNNQLIWNFNPVRDVVWFFIVLNSLISLKDCTNQIPNSFRLGHCIKLIVYCFLGLYRFLHKLVATETWSFTNSSTHEDWTRSNERSITQVGLLHFTSNYVGHIE